MKNINYKMSTLKIVDDLSEISKTRDNNTPIKFVKDLEGIHVKSFNESKSIIFTVDAPTENLEIENGELCFYNYSEFFKYVSVLNDPELSFGIVNKDTENEVEAIVMSKGKRKTTYPVSDPETITGSPKNNKVGSAEVHDASFKFLPENLIQFKKILSLIQGKKTLIKFTFSGKFVKVFIYSSDTNNTYEDQFELETEVDEEFSMIITKDVFKYLITTTYIVEASLDYGYIRFNFDVEDNKCTVLVTSEDEE